MATILIEDPDPAIRSLLELHVLRLGHEPIGEHQLAGDAEPDLMLLEPASRTGLRLAHRLRERLPQLPILCVSIEGPGPDSNGLDPVGHLMKPFRRMQLEQALEQALTAPGAEVRH